MDDRGEFVAELIARSAKGYSAGVVDRQLQIQPDVFDQYGSSGFEDLAGDTELRLLELAEALATDTAQLFEERIVWLRAALTARGVPLECLRTNLHCIGEELSERLPPGTAERALGFLQGALKALETAPDEAPSHLPDGQPHVDLARHYLLAVLETRRSDAIDMVVEAFEGGLTVPDIHRHVIAPVQAEIGRMWQHAEIHVAEEHYATAVATQVMAQLRSAMPRAASNGKRVLCTSVGGDLHDLGLYMVSDAFEMEGWQSIWLGASTPAVDLIHALHDFEADLLAVSTMIASQMRATTALIRAIRDHGMRRSIPILVGGAPYRSDPDLWRRVGADGYGPDAPTAVREGERLVG